MSWLGILMLKIITTSYIFTYDCNSSQFQRKGIGRKLLESFISSAKEQSKSVGLEVFKINTEAKRFYEGHGFKVEGETLNSYIMNLNA